MKALKNEQYVLRFTTVYDTIPITINYPPQRFYISIAIKIFLNNSSVL